MRDQSEKIEGPITTNMSDAGMTVEARSCFWSAAFFLKGIFDQCLSGKLSLIVLIYPYMHVFTESMNSTKESISPTPVRGFLSFPDGDLVLRSIDNIDFRIHSAILRVASGFFSDMSQLPQSSDSTPKAEFLRMEETSDILDIVLRLLYPTRDAPSLIRIRERGEAFLQAVNRLQISAHPVDATINAYFKSVEPLRAWALAIRFGYTEARQAAVHQFIYETRDHFSIDIPELTHISARDLVNLIRIKQETMSAARDELARLEWTCLAHRTERWCTTQRAMIEKAPFDPYHHSEPTLLDLLNRNHCKQCSKLFYGAPAAMRRNTIREKVLEILKEGVDAESEP